MEISDSDKAIIKDSRKTLLFHNNHFWGKKSGDPDFDVTMGCYDEAEVCELVRTFILNKLSSIIDKDSIGLYHDDSLGMFDKLLGHKYNRVKLSQFLKTTDLTTNITSILHLTLNLKTDPYQPFRQPNNNLIWIDINLNHPPQILKQHPKSISKRLSKNSSSKDVFDKSK